MLKIIGIVLFSGWALGVLFLLNGIWEEIQAFRSSYLISERDRRQAKLERENA